jgi:hypothetical protein
MVGIEKIAAGPTKNGLQRVAPAEEPAKVFLGCPDLDWVGHFEQLHTFAASCLNFAPDIDALNRLQWCYEATYGRDGVFKGDVDQQNAFIWPYQLGEEFTVRMQTQQPLSLIVAAHFALLLQNYEFTWYMVGWSDHIITGIAETIDENYRSWLEWPIEQARRIRLEKEQNKPATVFDLTMPDEPMPV